MEHEWDLLDIDDWLEVAAQLPALKFFYPSAISNATGIPNNVVFDRLLAITQEGLRLHLLWEVRCPLYDCPRTVKIIQSPPEEVIGEEYECMCGQEFEVAEDDIYPIFAIKESYKNRVQSKKKTEGRHKFSPSDIEASVQTPAISLDHLLNKDTAELLRQIHQTGILPQLNISIQEVHGGVNVENNSRNMVGNNFAGAKFGDNNAFQSDNVNQTVNKNVDDNPLSQSLVEQIKQIISEQHGLSEPMKVAANSMADQLHQEKDPGKRNQILEGLKGLVGPVASGLIVEAIKAVAGGTGS